MSKLGRYALAAALAAVGLTPLGAGQVSAAPAHTASSGASHTFDRLPGFALPGSQRVDGAPVRVRPSAYTAYDVDVAGLEQQLAAAPGRRASLRGAAPLRISVPDPDGTRHAFAVVEDPVMQSRLQARHPDIRTYAGRQVDDPTRTIRLDVSPLGFHASVRGVAGRSTWYVDPVVDAVGTTEHLSYYRSALPETEQLHETEPIEVSAAPSGRTVARVAAAARTAAGGVVSRRTYRLALITDPRYAAYFGTGGQPADPAVVLAEKVTLMNRVNQIYNDDMAFHMVLVDGTDKLDLDTAAKATEPNGPCGASACYDAADLDPDTGGCSSSLLDRNQFVAGQIIGADKYDIGHIMLGINGGGVAYLGAVGEDIKAGGCTGLPFPEGDFMAIDYVAHEMGHQFSGNHTFNGTQLNCSGGNRNAGTSVEPGSGSSVMAYAGICDTDDLQPHTDPYFSQRTIDEFTAKATAAPSSYNEVQTISLSGFDASGESIQLGYPGQQPVTIAHNALQYSSLNLSSTIFQLTGYRPTVTGYDGGLTVSDDGFTVTFNLSAGRGVDVDRLTVSSSSAGVTGAVGVEVNGGPGTNQGFTVEQTTDHAPSVTAPADKTIPLRTPFALTGSGSDVDGDPLVYLWEQNDVGGLQGTSLVSNSKTSGPLFRVFGTKAEVSLEDSLTYGSTGENLADGSATRVFPDLAQVLADNTNAATGSCPTATLDADGNVEDGPLECYSEFLPTSTRTLDFRLTARDQHPLGGGTQYDDVALSVGSAGPFRVTSQPAPAAGAPALSVTGGQPGTVTWDVAGTNNATYATNVKILLSSDGGQTFPTVLAESTANDGSADVVWPQVATDRARIMVQAVGNYFFDVNRAPFTIVPTTSVSVEPSTATAQYSDPLAKPLVVTVTSGQADGSALGLTLAGVPGLVATRTAASAAGVRPGTATFSVDGPVTAPVGAATLTLRATVPNQAPTSSTVPVTVTPEDASLTWTGERTVTVTDGDTPVTLSTTVAQPADGTAGDLTRARVTFVDRADDAVLCTATPTATGAASCAATFGAETLPATYTVGTVVSGDFLRDSAADDTVVVLTAADGGGGGGDSQAPETRVTDGPADATFLLAKEATFRLGADEQGVTYACTLDGVAVPCAGGTASLTGLKPGSHLFSAAATDAAGNTDATPATRSFGTPYGAKKLTRSSGWTLKKSKAYYGKRAAVTSKRNQTLRFAVTDATELALVVTKASGYGQVVVMLDGTKLRSVKLGSSRTKHRVLVDLGHLEVPRTGTVTVKTKANLTVAVEGLGVISAS